jgi:RimJ/RimL family protein N-acetyltransferase
MELRDISMSDLPFYQGISTDPVMWTELGGPRPREGLEEKLRGIVDDVEAGRIWYFVITPDESDRAPAGTVCIWDHTWNGETINEIGWMVIPELQGRGLATEAVGLTLDRARSEGRWGVIHAFPGVTNGPSNAICRKLGFSMIEEVDYTGFAGVLRCNHWVIDLSA